MALLCGAATYFNDEENSFVINLFSIRPNDISSPLTKLSILQLLLDKSNSAALPAESYVQLTDIYSYFDPMGISSHTINNAIIDLLKVRACEPYNPSDDKIFSEQRVALTFCGRAHMDMALTSQIYLGQMSLRTKTRSDDFCDRINMFYLKRKHDPDVWRRIISSFSQYIIDEDRAFVQIPRNAQYKGQQYLRDEFQRRWSWTPNPSARRVLDQNK